MSSNGYEHQNWTPVVLTKTNGKNKACVKKNHISPEAIRLNKIENAADDGDMKIETVSKEDSKIITELRNSKKLTQKDLAHKLNLNSNVISDIEKGTYPKNKALVQRVKKYLIDYKISE